MLNSNKAESADDILNFFAIEKSNYIYIFHIDSRNLFNWKVTILEILKYTYI